MYQLLPPEKDTGYNLRQRSHHLTLPFTDNNNDQEEFSAQNVIYGYLLGVCVGLSLPTGVCMYSSTYCVVYTLFAGLFTKLFSIFVLIFMLLSLSAFVRFLLKKLLACLLTLHDRSMTSDGASSTLTNAYKLYNKLLKVYKRF